MAAEVEKRAGLRHVYGGKLPGGVGTHEYTCCRSCQALLIERVRFTILKNILKHGARSTCHTATPEVR